jgi:D-glycero-D-manno-heptose 1,7-bisphosphate phosphatase
LDRDGTVIVEKEYLKDPAQVELCPGAAAGLRRLQEAGWTLFMVTNQSGIGRGYYTEADMQRVNNRMLELLELGGRVFRRIYFAPEAPGNPSRGRKPSPQFLFDARDEFGVDLSRSVMVGDKLIDLECGWNAGIGRAILVRTGYGAEVERVASGLPAEALVVDGLEAVAELLSG